MTAWADGKITGHSTCEQACCGRASIALLEVNPRFRRRGIGRRLLHKFGRRYPGASLFTSKDRSRRSMRRLLQGAGIIRRGWVQN